MTHKNFQTITPKMKNILREAVKIRNAGDKITLKAVSENAGYDQAGAISAEIKYLEKEGVIKRHGKPGHRDLFLTIEKEIAL